MRTVYRVLAYLVAIEVVIQAAAIAYAIFGEGRFIEGGGVVDKALMESNGTPFPEVVGFVVHGINGQMVIPLLAVLLLIASFFAKLPRGVMWAGIVVVAVALQVVLGLFGHGVPALGLLHGINALIVFAVAVAAARLSRGAPADRPARVSERAEVG